jgi:hypothetical protein
MKKLLFLLLTVVSVSSCTENERAKNYGGKEDITLKPSEEFVNATWKDDNLWLITKDTLTNEYIMREKSSYGVWEGEIRVKAATFEAYPYTYEELKH